MSHYAYCHFCDDIRFEIGNKTTLVGMYASEMQVAQLPVVLPKLCIAVFCSTTASAPIKELSFRVSTHDQVLQEINIPSAEMSANFQKVLNKSTESDPIQQIAVGVNLVLSPFIIEKEINLLVTAVADGEELPAGKLRIRYQPPATGEVSQ